jgi:diacylglycerol kinase family enzyme
MINEANIGTSRKFPYIVIAGGNGSFSLVLDQLVGSKVDLRKAIFCVLPLGVCNDLTQAVGWEAIVIEILQSNSIETLKNFIRELKDTNISTLNIWEVEAECSVSFNLICVGRK